MPTILLATAPLLCSLGRVMSLALEVSTTCGGGRHRRKSRHHRGKQRARAKMVTSIRKGVTSEPGGISPGWAVIGGQGDCWAGSRLEVLHRQSYQKTDFGDQGDGRLHSLVLPGVLPSPRVSPAILFLAEGRLCAFFSPSNSRRRLNVGQRIGAFIQMLLVQTMDCFL